jgi:hypothetical protein
MSDRSWRWLTLVAMQAIVVSAAILGVESRRIGPDRCALDGAAIEPIYLVRIRERDGRSELFCCVTCAELWIARSGKPSEVLVTDEISGCELRSALAWFVRSSVVTTQATQNRIHAFQNRDDAEKHAERARGRILIGRDRPFQNE